MSASAIPVRLTEAMLVDLVTFRSNGVPVHTPVLSTPRGATLLVRTHHTAGKLKRIRQRPVVEVAPCDGRGRLLGPARSCTARILPGSETDQCLGLLHARHGLIGRLATVLRRVRGMRDVIIEVSAS